MQIAAPCHYHDELQASKGRVGFAVLLDLRVCMVDWGGALAVCGGAWGVDGVSASSSPGVSSPWSCSAVFELALSLFIGFRCFHFLTEHLLL